MAYTSEIEKLEARFRENPKGRNFAPLADAYRKAGLVDNAIDLCESGLQLHPDYISAHIVYGRCRMDKKDGPGAQAVFRKVLALDPENVIALKILGEIAERNAQFEEAVEWLTRLLAADPMNGDAAEALARAKGKAAAARPAPVPVVAPPPASPAPEPTFEARPAPPSGLETFDGSIAVNPEAHAAAKADGLEVQEEVELNAQQVERVEIEGLARTQYEASGMFKLDSERERTAAMPAPESADEPLPEVDLPLIMPEELGPPPIAESPAPSPPPPRSPPPLPPTPRVPTEVPAAVRLADDDGAADAATLSQAEPVVTETMAELYLKQGHQQDALRVYQALLVQRPADARLKARIEQLSGGGRRKSGVSVQAFLKGILVGGGRAAPPGTTPEAAFEAADAADAAEPHPGAPTYAAADHISLDTVFGEGAAPRDAASEALPPPPSPAGSAPAPAPSGGFSFDQFFTSSARTSPSDESAASGDAGDGARTPGRSSGRTSKPVEDEGELDQFQQWLKKLKS